MFPELFQSTTVPILEQVANFAQSRHTVLAGNIANLDTPDYRVRDLSVADFQTKLKKAIEARHQPIGRRREVSLGEAAFQGERTLAEVSADPKTILYHDDSNVGLEFQVSEMIKNQMQHNLALTIIRQQFRLLEAAVSGRA